MTTSCQRSLRAALLACAACALWPLAALALSDRARSDSQAAPGYSATLEQCVASPVASNRSVTFAGQMVALPGTQRMSMRIELQERAGGQDAYHAVLAPGLGVWRNSETGVKIYKYVKQITNLAAPAAYRAVVRFRWLGEKGHVLRRAESRTARCVQPLLASDAATGSRSSGSTALRAR